MENLNVEEIKCGLEHCTAKSYKCEECPYFYKSEGLKSSKEILMTDALALINSQEQRIKELEQCWEHEHASAMEIFGQWSEKCEKFAEENERLKAQKYYIHSDGSIEMIPTVEAVRADTVRKMQERLKEHLEKPEFPWDSFTVAEEVIDQIAKEIIGGGNNG